MADEEGVFVIRLLFVILYSIILSCPACLVPRDELVSPRSAESAIGSRPDGLDF